VRVPGDTDARLLVVPENQNDGWTATLSGVRLTPIRLDGWQQAWIVPAGKGGLVTLSFGPQRTFVVGLVAGLLAAILVVVAAFWRRQPVMAAVPRRREAARGELVPLVLGCAAVVAIGGLWGVVVLAAAGLARRLLRVGEVALVALGVALVAVASWAPWPQPAATNHGALARLLALAMLALLVIPAQRVLPPRPKGARAPDRARDGSAGGPPAAPGAPASTS
jgi:arabinofuranan 3-O-arabinosyltransferase